MKRQIILAVCVILMSTAQAAAVTVQFNPNLNTQSFASSTDLKTATSDVIGIGVHTNGSLGPIRSFMTFNLSSLPVSPYLQITSATFSFNTQTNQGNVPNPLVLANLNTSFNINTSVSWSTINGSNNWTTPGGDIGNVLGTLSAPWSNSTAYTFGSTANFVQAVQDAYNANRPLQTLLYMPQQEAAFPIPSTAGGFLRIHARNNPTLAGVLTLNYSLVIPVPEPSAAVLTGFGVALLAGKGRRRATR